MARNFVLAAAAAALFLVSDFANADDIGVGKPGSDNMASSQITTQDDIGVGSESWYELMISWFESE